MTSNVTPFRNLRHVSLLWASPEQAEEIAALHAENLRAAMGFKFDKVIA